MRRRICRFREQQLLQIHDSILVECDPERAEEIGAKMKYIMESVAPELAIELRVDVSVGKSWGEL